MNGISECPRCGEQSVRVPVVDWTVEYNKNTGESMMTAVYDFSNVVCTRGCDLTNIEKVQYHVVGFTE